MIFGEDLTSDAEEPAGSAGVTPDYDALVKQAYGTIGRSGFGDTTNTIDQGGYDYWMNVLQTGASTPEAFQQNFNTAVQDYVTKNPADQYSQYVTNYQQNLNPYFQANPDVNLAYLERNTNPIYEAVKDYTPDQFAALHYDLYGEGEKRTATPDVTNTLVNNLYGSVGRISPDLIDKEGLDYWTNEIASKGYDAVIPAFNDAATRSYSSFLADPTSDPTGMLKTGFSNLANTGVASLLADKNLTLDEAYQLRQFANQYGVTPEQLSQYVNQGNKVVPAIFGAFDSGMQGLVTKALDPATSESDKARIELGLMSKYGLTYDDLARYSNGALTVDQVTGFLDPIKNYGSNFLGQLRGESYVGADQLAQYLNSNSAAREIYSAQAPYFDALAATKSNAATPEQIATIARYLGYTNGWDNPEAVANTNSSEFRDRFIGQPIQNFISYAISRNPGGEQGAPADIRERAAKLMSPFNNAAVDERTAEEFYRGVLDGSISEADALSLGVSRATAEQAIQNIEDPLYLRGYGESDQYAVRASDLLKMGYTEADLANMQRAGFPAPSSGVATPQYIRDPLSGRWIDAAGTSFSDSGESAYNPFTQGLDFTQVGRELGGPEGTKRVTVNSQNTYRYDPTTGEVTFAPGVGAHQNTTFWEDISGPLLAIASLIPSPVQPFAQLANAAMAINNGNILGGIAGLLGAGMPGAEMVAGANGVSTLPTIAQTLGLPSEVMTGLNVANAVQNKDIFGLLGAGANAAGVDLKGLDIGDIPVDKLLQGLGAIQALESGDIGALMGLAGSAFDLPELVKTAQMVRVAQAVASGNPYSAIKAVQAAGGRSGSTPYADGGLLSEDPPNDKVQPYYSGVGALLV